jgi:hypothetical protein
VTNGPNVAMRLVPLKFLLRHVRSPSASVFDTYFSICIHKKLERGTGFEPATITLEE